MSQQHQLSFDGAVSDPQGDYGDLPIKIIRHYLNTEQQQVLTAQINSLGHLFSRPSIKVFNQYHQIPRSQAWFGERGCDYMFSSLLIRAQPMPSYVVKLRDKLDRDFGVKYNGVLVNRYADGKQNVGWHSDNEAEIIKESPIASISLGASRDFLIRHNQTKKITKIELFSGDLLLMYSPMQQHWQHSLPKRAKVTTPRINLTFRQLIEHFHQ